MKKITYLKKENDKDNFLFSKEKILWSNKPNKKAFILNSIFKNLFLVIFLIIFSIIFITLLFKNIQEITWYMILLTCVYFSFWLIPVWMWIINVISSLKRYDKEEYILTDSRIIIKSGFIGETILGIKYEMINSVNLKIGLIDKLLKVGDIYIIANNQKVVFKDLNDVQKAFEIISNIISKIK